MCRYLALPNSHSLNDYDIETGGFAEGDDFARLACHAAERACRGGRADEGVGVDGEFFHAGLVAEDGAFAAFAAGVDGEDGDLVVVGGEHFTKSLDNSAFACSRNAGDAETDRLAAVGQTALDDLLSFLLVGI